MGRFDGMKGLVLGVANDHSLAWAIAKEILAGGGQIGFSHLPDRPDDERQRNRRRVAQLTDPEPNAKFLVPMDVSSDEQIAAVMDRAKQEFGTIDFVVHSIAYAPLDDLKGETTDCSREGFRTAMDISVYSFVPLACAFQPWMRRGGAMLCMTYYGAEKVVPHYNVMGVSKAALEASTRYLAYDFGPQGVRVNAISAGPIRTLAAAGVSGFKDMYRQFAEMAPLRENVTTEDVGNAAVFLCSDMAAHITGEVLYVDSGYSIMGVPEHPSPPALA
jgi:enoyl-[acyl-carrier protein] reductase I